MSAEAHRAQEQRRTVGRDQSLKIDGSSCPSLTGETSRSNSRLRSSGSSNDLARNIPAAVRSIEEPDGLAANITVQPNTIVAHIKTIREKIQKIDGSFACIKAERARGYRWLEEIGPKATEAPD